MKKTITTLALFIASMGFCQVPSYVPPNGLSGWWPFCGNANDLSLNANNGTNQGALLTNDRFGSVNSAYSFNGTSNFISTNYFGILGSSARAVSFWAKTINNISPMAAVSWGDSQFYPNTGKKFGCEFNYASAGLTVDGADCAITYQTPIAFDDNNWHHYVFQMDSAALLNQVTVFMDAIPVNTILHNFRGTSTMNTIHNFNVLFGKMDYSSPYFFQGSLDDIAIWNRVLTSQEILALYNGASPCSSETGLTELNNQNSLFSLYPNPVSSQLTITCNEKLIRDKEIQLSIYALDGRLIKTEQIKVSEINQFNVNTANLSQGLYHVEIKSNNYSQNIKFVKE